MTVREPRDLARLAAGAAASKLADEIVILDVRDVISFTDYFVIASGATDRQVDTIAEEVVKALKVEGARPIRREGEPDTGWMLIDFVDLVVHVFRREEREYYSLERLWGDAPLVPLEGGDGPPAGAGAKASSG